LDGSSNFQVPFFWGNETETGGYIILSPISGSTGLANFRYHDGTTLYSISGTSNNKSRRVLVGGVIDGTTLKLYINGRLDASMDISAAGALTYTDQFLRVGKGAVSGVPLDPDAGLSLLRVSYTASTDEQIRKIYNDEEWMFQPGTQVTLNGSSDAVTALAHDKVTDLLHVGTSGGMSVFDGLVRVSEDATAVTTSISANNSRIVRQ